MLRMKHVLLALSLSVVALPVSIAAIDRAHAAATAEDLDRDAADALQMLYRTNPVAQDLSKQARAILVFPNVVKAGLVFGGSYGEGVLRQGGRAVDYYNTASASWGLQAGAQSYGYALFLMNDRAVDYLRMSNGWEVGVGPTVVIVNEGAAKNLSTTTAKDDVYGFIFDQKGLMAGISIEGSKISRIRR
jgi:lipid-binding SYLF domain-containing protein